MVAIFKQDFETRTIVKFKMVDGKSVKFEEIVPKYKKDKRCEVILADMFWMRPEEIGGLMAIVGTMDYIRLTHPDGTKTQYYDLFELKNEE